VTESSSYLPRDRKRSRKEREELQRDTWNLLGVMDIFMILIVVIVSEVYMYDKMF